jgi:hypothetical protein
MTKEELIQKLVSKKHAPFLFLGSGFSRHYINTPDWRGILEMFAPKHINQYFSVLNTDNLPTIATHIAKDLTNDFWNLPETDETKKKYADDIKDQSILLKIKIADYLKTKSLEEFPSQYADEIAVLQKLCIDGIITTNWDDTAERMFPKFTPYIGQQELIFAPTFNIGEIYKIHGCLREPSSMVLTESDYNDYNEKNAYLAAKLITIFIEHPIIFMGYSISDINIMDLLRSLVCCMDKKNLDKLRDNLIFVDWQISDKEVFIIDSHSISLNNDIVLPVTRIETNSYLRVFECLSKYERTIPANLLREYKKQFYNIIVSEKPEKHLYVLPGEKIDQNSNIQVVYGFGAVSKYKSAVGYTGLKAINILEDIIDDKDLDAVQVLTKSIPNIRRGGQKKSFLTIYKYLSKIGISSKADYDNNQLGINIPLFSLKDFQFYTFSPEDKQLSLSEAIEKYKEQEWKAIALIPYLNVQENEMDSLRDFIKLFFNKYLVKRSNYSTYMRRLICFYDWKRYGWYDSI